MSQPWSPEQAIPIEHAGAIIEKQFPELKPAKLQKLGEGFDNSVFMVNDQYVFRFPRRKIAVELIETETRLLPGLAGILPIPVPNPIFQGTPDDGYPWPFAGYPIIKGQPPSLLTEEQRLQSVAPLARFLRTLHDYPIEKAKQLKIPFDEIGRLGIKMRKPRLVENMEKAKHLDIMHNGLVEALKHFLQTVPDDLSDGTQALVHGDLHIRNILVDDGGKVSGIIDWGDTHIGHPAVDLSMAYSFLPPKGRMEFFQIYGDMNETIKKMARFKAIYTAVLLLLYGHDLRDSDLVRESQTSLQLALQ